MSNESRESTKIFCTSVVEGFKTSTDSSERFLAGKINQYLENLEEAYWEKYSRYCQEDEEVKVTSTIHSITQINTNDSYSLQFIVVINSIIKIVKEVEWTITPKNLDNK